MADQKISELAPAPSIAGDELIPFAKSGENGIITTSQLKSYLNANSANIYGYVTAYADLPLGATEADPEIGDLVGVNTTTGTWILGTQKRMGFYRRVALTGVAADDYGTTPYSGFHSNAVASSKIDTMEVLTADEYAALGTKLDTTIYILVG